VCEVEDLEQVRQELRGQFIRIEEVLRRLHGAQLRLVGGQDVAIVHTLEVVLRMGRRIVTVNIHLQTNIETTQTKKKKKHKQTTTNNNKKHKDK
jgi:hypothetical protein